MALMPGGFAPTTIRGRPHVGSTKQLSMLWKGIGERQPDSAADPARRHIDQHQVHRPATEPVLLRRRFPARDRDLAAIHAPDPRALDLDLATVEADPSLRSAPTVRPPRRVATVARPAGRRDIRLHHRAERLDPCRTAEPI